MSRLSVLLGRTVRIALLAMGSYGGGSALAADAVLLTSTVPGYAPGMVVTATARLSLPDGASATLLFQSGEILRLRGPFDGTVAPAEPQGSLTALVNAFRVQGVDASVMGGTRAMSMGRMRAAMDDVHVDLMRSGTYCIQPSASVWLSRPGPDAGRFGLRRGGMVRMLSWPNGADRIEWPVNMTIEDGDKYEIIGDGGAARTITFRQLDTGALSQPAAVASGLLLGCQEQFGGALKQLARSVGPSELWLTTDRGRKPVYRAGEPIALTVKSDRDGYLYCVSTRENGTTIPIFPAGAVDGAQLREAVPLSIPGPRGNAAPKAGAAGTEQIRCWLADRDISPELPHALLSTSMSPLPEPLAAEVDSIFLRVGKAQVTQASLRVQVE